MHWSGQKLRRAARLSLPIQYIVVTQTGSDGCSSVRKCSELMHTLLNHSDIGYNFVVAGDGNVYEGRGWDSEGSKTGHLAACSLSVAFLGNFQETEPNILQEQALQRLLQLGVKYKMLVEQFKLVLIETGLSKEFRNEVKEMPNYNGDSPDKIECKI